LSKRRKKSGRKQNVVKNQQLIYEFSY